MENAKKNLVFYFGVGRHAYFPQKPVVNFLAKMMIESRLNFSSILRLNRVENLCFWSKKNFKFSPKLPKKVFKLKIKGQLISKCLFGILNSSKKTKEKNRPKLLWYLKSNYFPSFFGRIVDNKETF